MAKETKLLRKMYLLSDASVQKLKELDDAEKEFTTLDHRMKKILYDKKLTGHTKWMLYNNLLEKYNNLRRKMSREYETTKDKRKKIESNTQTETRVNPFDLNIRDNIPEFDEFGFSNGAKNRNNNEFFNNLENKIDGEGELEPLSPTSNRRLSAFSVASTSKKSSNPIRHHLMQDPTFTPDESYSLANPDNTIHEIESDEETPVLLKKKTHKPKNSVTLFINDHNYSIHKDDEDDFRDFAADEFKKYPMTEKLQDWRFQLFKKRKIKEFQEQMAAEKLMVDNEKKKAEKRKAEAEMAKLMDQNRREEEDNNREEEHIQHWSGASTTNRKSKSPIKKRIKIVVPRIKPQQPSMAEVFVKTKPTRAVTRLQQKGKGKSVRWYHMR